MAQVETRAARTPWPALLHRVVKTVRSRRLFAPGHHLLVAVSGGPDSVALLTLLHRLALRWQLRLTAVHFNYGLRGEESDEDQAFVVALCERLGIPLQCRALDVRTRGRRVSLQAEARERRYRALMTLAEEYGADRIALGHTADDQAETVLLWLLRGSGLAGLSGMPAAREGLIVRPLYEARRRDIMAYLAQSGQSYRLDSSNAKPRYTRNRIRHELIPVLGQIAPSAVEALCRLADLCREDEQYLASQVAGFASSLLQEDGQGGYWLTYQPVRALPLAIQRRLLREALRRCHPSCRPPGLTTVESVRTLLAKPRSSASLALKSAQVTTDGERLHLAPRSTLARGRAGQREDDGIIVAIPSQNQWVGTGQEIRVELVPIDQVTSLLQLRTWSMVVDADRVASPLMLRAWRRGDRFVPSGMNGRSKKLQDLFVDLKVPKAKRALIPLLVSPDGIVGVLGYRQDERFRVGPLTRRGLVISLSDSLVKEGAL